MGDFREYRNESVSVVGAGSWGTTVAIVIAEANPHLTVKLWAYEKQVVKSISALRENSMYLPGVKIPHNVSPTGNVRDCVFGSKRIILAPPSKAIIDTCTRIAQVVDGDAFMAFISKGFCRIQGRVCTISDAIQLAIPQMKGRVAAISGPSHAEEVSRKVHTCLSVASESREAREAFMRLLECSYLHCRGSDDVKGVELGGTLKNPAAVAAGMISALPSCGDNLAGALITESMREIVRVGKAMGAREETLMDISGLGDLVTTALSVHSRNRRFGHDIAIRIMTKGNTLGFFDRLMLRFRPGSVLAKMGEKLDYLAEGAYAIEPLIEIAAQHGIALPVYRSLYEILLNKKEPSLLIETIKDPLRFEELYLNTSVQIKEGRKGLEHTGGIYFRNMILGGIDEKYRRSEGLRNEIRAFVESLGNPDELQDRGARYARDASAGEFALLQDAGTSAVAARELSARYLDGIMDNYSPFFRFLASIGAVVGELIGSGTAVRDVLVHKSAGNPGRKPGTPVFIVAGDEMEDPASLARLLGSRWSTVPRFPVFQDRVPGYLQRLFLRRAGGYAVDRLRMPNPLYRELLFSYAGVMLAHGVSMIVPARFGRGEGSDARMVDALIATVTEIARNASVQLCIVPLLSRDAGGRALECRGMYSTAETLNAMTVEKFSQIVRADLGLS